MMYLVDGRIMAKFKKHPFDGDLVWHFGCKCASKTGKQESWKLPILKLPSCLQVTAPFTLLSKLKPCLLVKVGARGVCGHQGCSCYTLRWRRTVQQGDVLKINKSNLMALELLFKKFKSLRIQSLEVRKSLASFGS